jgi:hypothetical protein
MSAISKVVYGATTLIDLTSDTVVANKLLSGYTAHGADGEVVAGSCTFDADTSSGTATAGEILATKKAWVQGNEVTGSMTNNGSVTGTISDKTVPYTVPAGYHDGTGTVDIDSTSKSNIAAANIRNGVTILGVIGTYTGEAVPTEVANVTPYTTAQTINPTPGYNFSRVDVAAIAYSETANAGGGLTATIGTVAP